MNAPELFDFFFRYAYIRLIIQDELTSKRAAYKLTGEYCLLLIN